MISSISIAIPTLNNLKGLKKLISFFKKTKYSVMVIDNQPTAEKKELFNSLDKRRFFYYPQLKNLGFAKAINFAFKNIKTEWAVILNDDVEIADQNLFEKLLDYARKNNLIAVSPILKKPSGEIENLGYKVLPIGKIKLITSRQPACAGRPPAASRQIDGLTAACLLIKIDVFLKIRGFDQRFFAYLEDVDLFLRLKKSYSTNHQSPAASRQPPFAICFSTEVIHYHMQTGKTLGWRKNWLDFKNWILLILKHPEKFTLPNHQSPITNHQLLIERLRNLSGLIKKVFL